MRALDLFCKAGGASQGLHQAGLEVVNHAWQTPRFPPATNRTNLRSTVEVGVWRIPLEIQRQAMGIDWMAREELSQAIPPAFSQFLALGLLGPSQADSSGTTSIT